VAEQGGTSDALAELLLSYRPVLRDYLVTYRRMRPEDAEDLVQGFIANKMIADRLVSHANQTRGRFRSFLLKALEHYRISQVRQAMAKKRRPDGGVMGLADHAAAQASEAGASAAFDTAWARGLIQRCLDRFEAECAAPGEERYWEVFDLRVLRPAMTGERPVDYATVVERLAFASPREASNALITAKRRFGRLIRDEVSRYVRDERELDDEVRGLFRALAEGGAG
jgi:RNA polymerase sigma-70 factor (ECF subfamily)